MNLNWILTFPRVKHKASEVEASSRCKEDAGVGSWPLPRQRGDAVVEKLTALDAYREGRLSLPPGYSLEHDADLLILHRKEGSVVAAFSVRGTKPSEVARVAWEDHRENDRDSA
jgi:hypothetical protein